MIKVCINPHCEAVFHNCPESMKHCRDCDSRLMKINEETFFKKFYHYIFQYDATTMKFYRPKKEMK